MMPSDHSTYCLGCHKPLPEPSAVCPRCGADQEETRRRFSTPSPARRGRRPPARALNAIADAPCPTCHVRVPAGAPSCLYCGHAMLTDLPEWKTDSQDARPYTVAALACSGLGVLGFALYGVRPVFGTLGLLCTLAALLLSLLAHGENPLGWGGLSAVGITIGAAILGLALLAVAIAAS